MPAGDLTMTPEVTANEYTVSYNANGGSGAPSSQKYTYSPSGTITLSSTIPTRQGYEFLGWSTSSDDKSAIYTAGDTFDRNTIGNTTLYAVWVMMTSFVTVYDSNGGSEKGTIRIYVNDTNLITNDGDIFKDKDGNYFMTSDGVSIYYGIITFYDENGNPHMAI